MINAFIIAKGHSDRVPNKHFRTFGNQQLISHSIHMLKQVSNIDQIILDSDDDHLLKLGERCGAIPMKRKEGLNTNETTADDLIYEQAKTKWAKDCDYLVQISPCTPFLQDTTVDMAIHHILKTKATSLALCRSEKLHSWGGMVSGVLKLQNYHRNGRLLNSQELMSIEYETTGLYVTTKSDVLKHHRRLDPYDTVFLEANKYEAVDINTEEDWEFAETLWKGFHASTE